MNRHGMDARSISEEARRWNQQHADPLKHLIKPHDNDRTPDRRLRIGYVSPDFLEHPVGRFMLPLLSGHDRKNYEIFAYASMFAADDMTLQLRSQADRWQSIAGLSDEKAAELIRRDGIDILVDLTGHTANNRLLLFARKPAPVQVTYLGYPATTGLDAIDYRLTDVYADPPQLAEKASLEYSEELVRLSTTAWCIHLPQDPSPNIRPQGPVNFGCFNNFAKVNPPLLKLWASILKASPGSRLLLKCSGLQSEDTRERLRQLFHDEGVNSERLELISRTSSYAEHLALYHQVDIALDASPYHGTTTTCEALWLGVPVVSLAGNSHVSAVGVSLLSNVGLPDLIARSPDDYVKIAANLAADRPRLAALRSTLRSRVEAVFR